jgi:predicted neutral ceramidase superfamily lipid hydrolase
MKFAALQKYGNEVISAQKIGMINDIQITFSSEFQIVGTGLGSILLAWLETNNLSNPFNYHFTFLIMLLITLGIIKITYSLKFVVASKTRMVGQGIHAK